MNRTIERAAQTVHDLDVSIEEARERLDAAWVEIDVKKQQAALRRGRRKNMERSAAERARTRKLCQKAGKLETAGIIDEDDDVLLGIFLAAREGLKEPARRDAWRRRGQVKQLKRAPGTSSLIIRFLERPPAFVLAKLDEDGFAYDSKQTRWLGDGDLAYGQRLVELSGVGGKAVAGPPRPKAEGSG
jgi:hypothetical protein